MPVQNLLLKNGKLLISSSKMGWFHRLPLARKSARLWSCRSPWK